MKSPLAPDRCGNCTKYAKPLIHVAAWFALALIFCAYTTQYRTAQGQNLSIATESVFYPQTLAQQLHRVIKSPAHEVQALREVCTAILDDLHNVVAHIEQHSAEPCPELLRLEESISTLETFQTSWTATPSVPDALAYVPSAVTLEEMTLALKRRILIWGSLLKAEAAEAAPITTLYGKDFADINRLRERTIAVEQFFERSRRVVDRQTGQTWGHYLGTQDWLTELEAYNQHQAQPIRRVSLSSPVLPVEVLKTLGNRANRTILRLESPNWTNEQRAFLGHSTVQAWKEELQSWTADIVAPVNALRFLEQYEATSGMSDMKAFSQFIDLLTTSKTPEYRHFGETLRRQYGMSNVRLFISSALLNNHLPPPASEVTSFREVIQSQPIVGRRQTDSAFVVTFIPHPTRILMSLDVGVDLATFSRSDAFATQLFSTGQTLVLARKLIELTEKGFVTEPSRAEIIEHRIRLSRVETDFDGVPIVQGLFRGAVRNQYEDKFPAANRESQQKILRQVRGQVDREAEKRLRPINEQIGAFAQFIDEEFGLHVEGRGSQTDEDWLITSWGIRSHDSLMGSTLAPETLPGAFADLKIHESLPNLLLGRFEFEGQRATVGEFKGMLAEKFRQPALAEWAENDDVEITFAARNPVIVRFVDGRIELTISIAALRLPRQTIRNFQAIVRYKSAHDSEGRLVLERDGYLSLINVREQFLMRTVFGKIFPVSRPLPLVPKILDNDPQLHYLTTGHCRIEKGWLALALLEKEE